MKRLHARSIDSSSITGFLSQFWAHKGGEDNASRPAGEGPAPPTPHREQPLEVLTQGGHNPLAIHLAQASQAEAPQAVPLLGFSEQRLNPDPALLVDLLVGRRLVVAVNAFQVGLIKTPADATSVSVLGAVFS